MPLGMQCRPYSHHVLAHQCVCTLQKYLKITHENKTSQNIPNPYINLPFSVFCNVCHMTIVCSLSSTLKSINNEII